MLSRHPNPCSTVISHLSSDLLPDLGESLGGILTGNQQMHLLIVDVGFSCWDLPRDREWGYAARFCRRERKELQGGLCLEL